MTTTAPRQPFVLIGDTWWQLVTAAVAAGMRAVAHRGERLGQADALVRSVDGRLRVAHGREGLGEADALVGAVGGGAFGYVGSMFGHR